MREDELPVARFPAKLAPAVSAPTVRESRMRTNRLSINIAVAIFSVILCLLVAELVFRTLSASRYIYPGVVYRTEDPAIRLWCYDEHFNGVSDWDLRREHPFSDLTYLGNIDKDPTLADVPPTAVPFAIEIKMNENGFRERPFGEFNGGNGKGSLTLLIGDSFGFGQGVRVRDRFSNVLEARLSEATSGSSGVGPKMANLCLPGYNIGKVGEVMERYVDAFDQVDRVVYAFTLNDPKRSRAVQEMAQTINDFMHLRENRMTQPLPLGADHLDSAMLRYFAKRVVRNRLSESTVEWYREMYAENIGWTLTKRKLLDMHRFCLKRGAPMTLVVFPLFHDLKAYPFVEIHRKIGDFARENDIAHVDLLPAFEGGDERDYWVHPKDFHPNDRAHRKAADFLLTAIRW